MLCLNDKSVAKHKSACIWLDNFLCHSFKSPHTMMSIVTHKMLIVYCHLRPPPLIIWNIIYVVLSNNAEHQSRESLPPFFFVVSAFWNVCRQEFINGLTLIRTNVSDSKFIVLFFFSCSLSCTESTANRPLSSVTSSVQPIENWLSWCTLAVSDSTYDRNECTNATLTLYQLGKGEKLRCF